MVFARCRPLLRLFRHLYRRRPLAILVVLVTPIFLFSVNVARLRQTHLVIAPAISSPSTLGFRVSCCSWNASNSSTWEKQPEELMPVISSSSSAAAAAAAPVQQARSGGRRMFVKLPASAARLGNQMFAHAAMLGVAHSAGFQATESRASQTNGYLLETFALNSTPVVDDKLNCAVHWHASKTNIFTPPESMHKIVDSTQISSNEDVELVGYFQSWRYFADVSDQVIADFQFKPSIEQAASVVVERIIAQYGNKTTPDVSPSRHVLVGVHARRGDMATPTQISRGYRVADEKYFVDAMEFVEKRVLVKTPSARIIYVVCSDEPSWSQASISSKRFPVYHSKSNDQQSTAVDLATLASCDHVIMSTGTFGWWAGYLANARRATNDTMVIYYANFPPPETEIGSTFLASDFYPPSWIGLP